MKRFNDSSAGFPAGSESAEKARRLIHVTGEQIFVAGLVVWLVFTAGCQSSAGGGGGSKAPASSPVKESGTNVVRTNATKSAQSGSNSVPADTAKSASTNEPPTSTLFSAAHDAEINAILDLAKKGDWVLAEQKARELRVKAPTDPAVERVQAWVAKEGTRMRERAVEERIREIDAKNSVFNPTVIDLLKEKKDRGLPPRQDVRDLVQRIESTPYIPENFGRTNVLAGPMFDVQSSAGRMSQILQKEISVHLDNVTLEAIIFNIGQAEGINFVADKSIPAFKQNLSVNMKKVRLSEFLSYVSRNLDVQFQVGGDLIWIIDAKDPKKVQEETRFYRLRKGFVMPAQHGQKEVSRVTTTAGPATTVTENVKLEKFVNDEAPASPSIEKAIKDFFGGSKYMLDFERNLIVAKGTREQLEVMDKIVAEFDRALQQVLIEARFVTITEAAFLQLGATWETGRDQRTTGRTPTDFTGLGLGAGLGIQESFTNVLSRPSLSATLTALQQDGESQTLSAPRLTLINNRPARISDGKIQYYYEEYTVKQTLTERNTASSLVPSGKPTRVTSGVSLDVLASIGGDGQSILLALNPQVNQEVKLVNFATISDRDAAGNVVSTFEIKLPESRTQELSTRVVIKSGQTVVMGGVLEREQRTFVESVPVLGNIPLIGAAFRKRTEVNKPRYLLIFVTATLLSESGEFLSYETTEKKAEPAR